MQILVADDDPVYRSLLESLLEESHFEVVLAADGAEAWAILQQDDTPELAILDWMMPNMDGYEVCRQVRATKGNAVPYILLMTSNGHRDELLRILVAGADDYLLKPFEPLDLKIHLRAAIRILNLEAQLRPRSLT
ncbi:MAG: response regulator transcription factor [Phycisphaerae bacterium]|jgi:DNA-binding response OmpR family regulator